MVPFETRFLSPEHEIVVCTMVGIYSSRFIDSLQSQLFWSGSVLKSVWQRKRMVILNPLQLFVLPDIPDALRFPVIGLDDDGP